MDVIFQCGGVGGAVSLEGAQIWVEFLAAWSLGVSPALQGMAKAKAKRSEEALWRELEALEVVRRLVRRVGNVTRPSDRTGATRTLEIDRANLEAFTPKRSGVKS